MTYPLVAPLAMGVDALAGEPRRFHPLVGFGAMASALERRMNDDTRIGGVVAMGTLVLPLVILVWYMVSVADLFGPLVDLLFLWLALGAHALKQHADAVRVALLADDLPTARRAVSMIVSRDTDTMTVADVARATVESFLENGLDAIFGALFWYAVAGAPGVVAYRLVNTLDAMWGYRTERYARFGWGAARLDDAMNYLPARLTAATYALFGDTRRAVACWRAQGGLMESPNAGPVMAAGAGALGIRLGGADVYHGALKERPTLGAGNEATPADIDRAGKMVMRGMVLWGALIPLVTYVGRVYG